MKADGNIIGVIRESICEIVGGMSDSILEEIARNIARRLRSDGLVGHVCTARTLDIVRIAERIGEHWRDQDGISGQMLDELAEATKYA